MLAGQGPCYHHLQDQESFHRLLGDGSSEACLSTMRAAQPDGLAQAFLIGAKFLADSPAA